MRVYHFTSAKHGLENISRRRLKIATIHDLNDPFELIGPSTNERNVREVFRHWKNQMATRFGMLCFTLRWSHPMHWSHYGEKHRGLCLGFDVSDKHLTEVNYSQTRLEPEIETILSGGPAANAAMLKVLKNKYSSWRYEQEMRLFTRLEDKDKQTGMYFADFSRTLKLREVIVGHESIVTRAEVKAALGALAPRIHAYKARLAFHSFRVVRQRNESMWS